jgi:hypothetical protein
MAAPNIIGATLINGKTTGANLTATTATSILNNAASSGKCLKINVLNVSNYTAATANITISYYSAASLGGNVFNIVGRTAVPGNSTLNVIDKSSQYYLEENTSLGATADTVNAFHVTCSYEDIS